MQKIDIEKVLKIAGKSGDVAKAALTFLGLKKREGSEAAVDGVVAEVEQWRDAPAAVRKGIEAYKSAKLIKAVVLGK